MRFDVCWSEVSTKIEDIRTIFEGEMSPHHPYKWILGNEKNSTQLLVSTGHKVINELMKKNHFSFLNA